MKKINKYILLFSLFAGIFTSSCNKDSSTTQESTRSSLTGKWVVTETTRKITYEVTILIDSSTTSGVLINNFAGGGPAVNALAYFSGTSLSLTPNELLSNGWIVDGSGSITGTSRIDWMYTLHDGANQTSIQAVYTKK